MIGASVRRGLSQDGFTVDWVEDGRAAELALAERVHDAVLLDLGLPRKSGLEVLSAMRRGGDTRPVLIMTARDAVADRVAGLDAGADDYVVKPFDLTELAARLRALARRRAGRADPILAYGVIELDPASHQARVRGASISLSAREFALLQALLARPGPVLSPGQSAQAATGGSCRSGTRAAFSSSFRSRVACCLKMRSSDLPPSTPKMGHGGCSARSPPARSCRSRSR